MTTWLQMAAEEMRDTYIPQLTGYRSTTDYLVFSENQLVEEKREEWGRGGGGGRGRRRCGRNSCYWSPVAAQLRGHPVQHSDAV